MQLADQQKQALYKIVSGIREKGLKQQTLGGYAGTGKTTLINYLVQLLDGDVVRLLDFDDGLVGNGLLLGAASCEDENENQTKPIWASGWRKCSMKNRTVP